MVKGMLLRGKPVTWFHATAVLAVLFLIAALPRIAAAATDSKPTIKCVLGPGTCSNPAGPPSQSTPLSVSTPAPSPPGYDFIHVLNLFRGFNDGGGGAFSYNNKVATTDKKKDKAGCQGHVGDPVEVDDGAKLLS